jgi:AFG3 family protein
MEMLAKGDVEKIEVVNKEFAEIYIKKKLLVSENYQDVSGYATGAHFYFNIGSVDTFENKLEAVHKEYALSEPLDVQYSKRTNWVSVIFSWPLPLLIFFMLWRFITSRTIGTGGMRKSTFDFGKTAPKVLDNRKGSEIRFDDVAGLESAKTEVKEIVTFLKSPED